MQTVTNAASEPTFARIGRRACAFRATAPGVVSYSPFHHSPGSAVG